MPVWYSAFAGSRDDHSVPTEIRSGPVIHHGHHSDFWDGTADPIGTGCDRTRSRYLSSEVRVCLY